MVSHRSSACLDISRTARLQYPAGILPERISKKKKRKKRRKRAHGSNNSNYHKSKWTYYHNSHSDSVFFYLCAWGWGGGGRNARSLSYPSPLRSACQPASQAEPGRRNSGHNEIDDNKAEDGEMAVTEWDGAQQFAWPEMKRAAFLTSRTSTRNCESKSSLWQLMDFSSFPEAGRCPEQYRAPLSTSFRDNYELNMATYHTGGDGMKIQSVPDTCFLRIIWWK